MATKNTIPIPRDEIKESFVWRDWFQRLSDKVYGTLASQDANSVVITGGSISNINFNEIKITNSTIDNSPIGSNIPSTGSFTSLKLKTPLAVVYGGTGTSTATANYVFAGPTSGGNSAPTFRALVTSDIPTLPYAPTTSGASILYGNGTGGFSNVTIGSGISFAAGTLSATGSGGTVTSVTGTSPVVSSGGTTPAISMAAANTTTNGYLTSTDWNTFNGKQAAGTYVTSLTVASANGFAGSFTSGATPALAVSTSITGLLKGNGTAISAAVANTDYVPLSTVLTKTADYTIANTDMWIINNKTGSALTLTFPAASSWTGRAITVKNMQAQLVNSATSNIVPIDSVTAGTVILLGVVGNWATMVSDGTNWIIMQAASNNNLLLE